MSKIFTNATEARRNTRNNVLIHNEVRSIENQVLSAVDSGELVIEVTNTTITQDQSYYQAWFGITANPSLLDQIEFVQEYFRNLGYSIQVLENASTGNTIKWRIAW